MNILGRFKATADGFTGHVRTLAFNAPVDIRPVMKRTDSAPDYHVYSGEAHIGAAWKAKAATSGIDYLRVTIDEASLAEPIHASLFTAKGDAGDAELVWTRPRRQGATGRG